MAIDFSFIQDNAPKKDEQNHNTNDGNVFVTIRVDADCFLQCDGEYIEPPLKANQTVKVQIPVGQHLLEFIKSENARMEKTVDYPIAGRNYIELVSGLKDIVEDTQPVNSNDNIVYVTFRVDGACRVLCDGEDLGVELDRDGQHKFEIPLGQHLLEFIGKKNSNQRIEKVVDYTEVGSNYIEDIVGFAPDEKEVGTIMFPFSVAQGVKIYFSKGNLQKERSTNKLRFAEKQYDFWGVDNSYSDWIDLLPWEAPKGYMVSNGGNPEKMWRILTEDEWRYLLNGRKNCIYLRGFARIDGKFGFVFLPDDWNVNNNSLSFIPLENLTETKPDMNEYSIQEWEKMEANGAVFLPAAGRYRNGSGASDVGFRGNYWSSSEGNIGRAIYLYFNSNDAGMYCYDSSIGRSVRLVRGL